MGIEEKECTLYLPGSDVLVQIHRMPTGPLGLIGVLILVGNPKRGC